MAERSSPARHCFGCGSENPHGMGLEFRLEGGRAVASYTPPAHLQGYPGRVHGGGVAAMVDEAMGWAVYSQGAWAVTARLTLRFRHPVPLEQPLALSARVTRDRGQVLELHGEVRSPEGVLLAEGEGLFVRVRGNQAEELRRLYEAGVS